MSKASRAKAKKKRQKEKQKARDEARRIREQLRIAKEQAARETAMIAEQMRIAEEQRAAQAEQFRLGQEQAMAKAYEREQAMMSEFKMAEEARLKREEIASAEQKVAAANLQRAGTAASLQIQPTVAGASGTGAFKKRRRQLQGGAKAYKGIASAGGATGQTGTLNI